MSEQALPPQVHPMKVLMRHLELNIPGIAVKYVDIEKWASDPKLLTLNNRMLHARIDYALDKPTAERRTRTDKTYGDIGKPRAIELDETLF